MEINNEHHVLKNSLEVAPPVYFCTVEPRTEAEEKKLNYALECLQREDPSLRVSTNEEDNLGQTIIQGMGELHLEIIKDRILKEYNLNVYFGPLNIAYKETPTVKSTHSFRLEKVLGQKKNLVEIELTVVPQNDFKFEKVVLKNRGENNLSELPFETLRAVDHGIQNALNKGKFALIFKRQLEDLYLFFI